MRTACCCLWKPRRILRIFSARISARCWRFWKGNAARLIESRNDANNASDDFGFVWRTPRFRQAARQWVGLHDQVRSDLMEPAASVTTSNFHEVHGPIVFAGPIGFLDASQRDVHQNDTSGPQERHHPPVFQSNVSIAMPFIGTR